MGNGNKEFKLERVTNAAPTITTDHQYIHEGKAFTIANKMDIATNKVGALQITTPAAGLLHFRPVNITAVGGPIYASLLEDYSFVDGSAITPVNRRRIGTPPASAATVKGATDISAVAGAAAVSLSTVVIVSTSQGSQQLGGAINGGEEWPLNPSTNYLITFTNTAGTTSTVGYELFWYEESDG